MSKVSSLFEVANSMWLPNIFGFEGAGLGPNLGLGLIGVGFRV